MFDIAIVGGGVVGGMIARTLASYQLNICILEKAHDVATGASAANSAIVHAGYDAKEGSLKAKLNVRGSQLMPIVCQELGVKYQNNGSLVIGFNEDDRAALEALLVRGNKNGVAGLRILEKDELHALEPNLSENVLCALHAPTGAIVCPYELAIAAVGNAMDNGAELKCNFAVSRIEEISGGYEISAGNESLRTKIVINAAGVFADKIAGMIGDDSFTITPRRGEYILLDKECGSLVSHTIFRTPSKMGKGILVSPTVDGNLLTGPTSENIEDRLDKTTTVAGLARVIKETGENVDGVPFNKSITSFTGLRAVGNTGDFIINSPKRGFINVAGIESPGLSASPAIAKTVESMLEQQDVNLAVKSDYNPYRKAMHHFRNASISEKNEIIKKDSSFGRIICRCEGVSEGEILEAIRTNPKPSDIDGVKRRTRAQMGRCQGGFCSPYIMKMLAREMGVSLEDVTKKGGQSKLIVGRTKEDMQ